MATVKTAISIPEELFEKLERLAREMKVSRSRLLAQAAEAFIKEQENRRILEKLKEVYGEEPDDEERALAKAMKPRMRRLLDREKW